MDDAFKDNLVRLSSLCRYNTERRQLFRALFDEVFLSGDLSESPITDSDIDSFAETRTPEPGGNELNESLMEELLLTLPDDLAPDYYRMYLDLRYEPISGEMRDTVGFSAVDLVSMEIHIHNLISERASQSGINDEFAQFSPEEIGEYGDISSFKQVRSEYIDEWERCITFEKKNLVKSYMSVVAPQLPVGDVTEIDRAYDAAMDMVDFLLYSTDSSKSSCPFQFIDTPLFSIDHDDANIAVPFPEVLVSTSQVRIESIIQSHSSLKSLEDGSSGKGDHVESLVHEVLASFESQNFVKNYQYIDGGPHESDALLFLDESYWAVEIKSHPIFRKFPDRLDTARRRFIDKATDGIEQGQKTIQYLIEGDDEFGTVYNLSGCKNPHQRVHGTIVVLDGFLPTLFTQNARADSLFGTSAMHDILEDEERVYLITLYDLYMFTTQPEVDRFEEFLKWRTDYYTKMPAIAFSEREYWALFFDVFDGDEEYEKAFEDMIESDMMLMYISERFNSKVHLPTDGFERE